MKNHVHSILCRYMHLLSNRDTNGAEESVVVSEVTGVLISEVEMHARVVLGVGKGVLFREVSSVQSPHITTWQGGRPKFNFIPCNGSLRRNGRSDIGGI